MNYPVRHYDRGMAPRRAPPKLSPSYLENAALHYLERFASSTANLNRVLSRKAARSLAHWGGEAEEARAMIAAVIERLTGLGYLDDAAYARQKAESLHRRGGSLRLIRQTLKAKGVEADEAALSGLGSDLAAARALARRRRLGPFRPENRADHRQRDLAALARAGFDYHTARQVIDGGDEEGE